jgi:hypothetical protein
MLAGALEIQIAANLARLTTDMSSARGMINEFAKTANTALATIGVAGGTAGLVMFVQHVNDATAQLKDFGKEAGTTAAAISRFDLPARAAGSSLETVANAIFRVSKSAVEARDPSSQAALALDAIGLSAKDLKGLKPDEMFELLARRVNTFSDGVEKNTVMQILFNKSGREMNKVVSDIAETSQLAATVTNEQAEEANKLNRQIIEMKMQSEQLWRSLVSQGVPALNEILKAFNEGHQAAGLYQAAIDALSVAFDKMAGPMLIRNKTELLATNEQIQAIQEWQAASQDAFVTEGTRTAEAAKLNALLQRRAELESMISVQEIADQDRRAAAGQAGDPKKPPPQIDLDAAKRAALFAQEVAQLEQEKAKLNGVSEVELYLMKLEGERFKLLTTGQKKRLEELAAENASIRALADATEAYNRLLDSLDDHEQGKVDRARQMVEAMQDENDRQAFQNTLIGKSAEEQRLATIEFERMVALRGVDNEQLIEAINHQYDLKAATTAQGDAMRNELSLWNEVGEAAGRFFNDVLLNGKSAVDSLKQLMKQLLSEMIAIFAKRWILNMAAGGSVGGSAISALGTATGGGSGSSLLGTGLSVAGNYGAQALGYTGLGTVGEFAGAFSGAIPAGAIGADAVAAGVGIDTAAAGAGSALSAGLAAIPVWGWIALAVIAAFAAFSGKGGGPKGGGSFAGNFDGTGAFTGAGLAAGTQNGRLFTPATDDGTVQQIVTGFGQSFGAALQALGGTSGGVTFGLGYDTDPHGRAGDRVSSVLSDASGQILYQNTNASTGDSLGAALNLEAQRALLAALQASELPKQVADILNSVMAAGASSEDIQRVIAMATEMANVMKALPSLNLHIDIDGLRAMAQAGESIGQTFTRLATTMAQFDDAFMSDAEKLAKAQKEVADGFHALGLAIPSSKDAFMELVHGLDLTTEAGRALFNSIMALAPAFLITANATGPAAQGSNGLPPGYYSTDVNVYDQMAQAFLAAAEAAKQLATAQLGLKDYVQGLLLNTQLSPLSLDQRFFEAEHQYQQLRDAAKGGDLSAYAPLQGASTTYLTLARQLLAGADYNAIYRQVVTEVGGVAGISQQELNSRLNGALPQGSTMASSNDIARVESAVNRLLDRISNGTITVSDPETKAAVEELKTEVATAGGGLLSK